MGRLGQDEAIRVRFGQVSPRRWVDLWVNLMKHMQVNFKPNINETKIRNYILDLKK